jgi:hypothetical protein
MEEHKVTLPWPSYLLFADESGTSAATAIFTDGTTFTDVPLSTNTFTQVGQAGTLPLSGTQLVAFKITIGGQEIIIHPETDLTSEPFSWGVLQPPPQGAHVVYSLEVLQDGVSQVVLFTAVNAGEEKLGPGPAIRTVNVQNSGVYNDLSLGILNLGYRPPGVIPQTITTPVGRGGDTGGLITGDIIQFDIRVADVPQVWFPSTNVTVGKGLPVIVFGEPTAPSLAIIKEHGTAEIVSLFQS